MEVAVLCLLGFVQGLCEFLPVSSSGHLVLLSSLFGVEDSLFVSIILHVATLLAVVIVFRKDVWQMIRHPFSEQAINLYIATIPTCIIVLILMPLVDISFGGSFLAISFLLSAILLIFSSRQAKKTPGQTFTKKHAIIMGIAQGFAVFPGLSRSGTTICAGLLCGGDKKVCAKFSFLMSLPIIVLSLLMEIYNIAVAGQTVTVNTVGLLLAFIIAFVVGVLSIKVMIKLTEKANFKWFAIYLILLSIISLIVI